MKKQPMSWIASVRLDEYDRAWPKSFQPWLRHRVMPERFWVRVKKVDPDMTLGQLLLSIRRELFLLYGKKRDRAKSFADSRFTSLPNILQRGMTSCGAFALIFATALRKHCIPVKLVHGRISHKGGKYDRHAWLKVYDARKKLWIIIDPTTPMFKLRRGARQKRIYSDWRELRADYLRGDY